MITKRLWYLLATGAVVATLGLVRGQELTSLIGLSILAYLFIEWLLFRLQLICVLRFLDVEREVNGRVAEQGTLWTGQVANVEARFKTTWPFGIRVLRIADMLPESVASVDGQQEVDTAIPATHGHSYTYQLRPLSAGPMTLPGYSLQLFDLHGLFYVRVFVECRQDFNVLPMPHPADGPSPTSQRMSVLPPPGIHPLPKAGMGAELLELREYTPGDPPKSIAWKVSARRDTLMIRQNESEVPVKTTLFVDYSPTTFYGSFGSRPIDQIISLAATIGKSSLSVRDPVGLTKFDAAYSHVLQPRGGERHFYRILDELAQVAGTRLGHGAVFSDELLLHTWSIAEERFPLRLRWNVNRVPWTIFPIGPNARLQRSRCARLANLFGELYKLPLDAQNTLLADPQLMAHFCQRFLAECGSPAVYGAGTLAHHEEKLDSITGALHNTIARARDNQLFVILIDLMSFPLHLGNLVQAI